MFQSDKFPINGDGRLLLTNARQDSDTGDHHRRQNLEDFITNCIILSNTSDNGTNNSNSSSNMGDVMNRSNDTFSISDTSSHHDSNNSSTNRNKLFQTKHDAERDIRHRSTNRTRVLTSKMSYNDTITSNGGKTTSCNRMVTSNSNGWPISSSNKTNVTSNTSITSCDNNLESFICHPSTAPNTNNNISNGILSVNVTLEDEDEKSRRAILVNNDNNNNKNNNNNHSDTPSKKNDNNNNNSNNDNAAMQTKGPFIQSPTGAIVIHNGGGFDKHNSNAGTGTSVSVRDVQATIGSNKKCYSTGSCAKNGIAKTGDVFGPPSGCVNHTNSNTNATHLQHPQQRIIFSGMRVMPNGNSASRSAIDVSSGTTLNCGRVVHATAAESRLVNHHNDVRRKMANQTNYLPMSSNSNVTNSNRLMSSPLNKNIACTMSIPSSPSPSLPLSSSPLSSSSPFIFNENSNSASSRSMNFHPAVKYVILSRDDVTTSNNFKVPSTTSGINQLIPNSNLQPLTRNLTPTPFSTPALTSTSNKAIHISPNMSSLSSIAASSSSIASSSLPTQSSTFTNIINRTQSVLTNTLANNSKTNVFNMTVPTTATTISLANININKSQLAATTTTAAATTKATSLPSPTHPHLTCQGSKTPGPNFKVEDNTHAMKYTYPEIIPPRNPRSQMTKGTAKLDLNLKQPLRVVAVSPATFNKPKLSTGNQLSFTESSKTNSSKLKHRHLSATVGDCVMNDSKFEYSSTPNSGGQLVVDGSENMVKPSATLSSPDFKSASGFRHDAISGLYNDRMSSVLAGRDGYSWHSSNRLVKDDSEPDHCQAFVEYPENDGKCEGEQEEKAFASKVSVERDDLNSNNCHVTCGVTSYESDDVGGNDSTMMEVDDTSPNNSHAVIIGDDDDDDDDDNDDDVKEGGSSLVIDIDDDDGDDENDGGDDENHDVEMTYESHEELVQISRGFITAATTSDPSTAMSNTGAAKSVITDARVVSKNCIDDVTARDNGHEDRSCNTIRNDRSGLNDNLITVYESEENTTESPNYYTGISTSCNKMSRVVNMSTLNNIMKTSFNGKMDKDRDAVANAKPIVTGLGTINRLIGGCDSNRNNNSCTISGDEVVVKPLVAMETDVATDYDHNMVTKLVENDEEGRCSNDDGSSSSDGGNDDGGAMIERKDAVFHNTVKSCRNSMARTNPNANVVSSSSSPSQSVRLPSSLLPKPMSISSSVSSSSSFSFSSSSPSSSSSARISRNSLSTTSPLSPSSSLPSSIKSSALSLSSPPSSSLSSSSPSSSSSSHSSCSILYERADNSNNKQNVASPSSSPSHTHQPSPSVPQPSQSPPSQPPQPPLPQINQTTPPSPNRPPKIQLSNGANPSSSPSSPTRTQDPTNVRTTFSNENTTGVATTLSTSASSLPPLSPPSSTSSSPTTATAAVAQTELDHQTTQPTATTATSSASTTSTATSFTLERRLRTRNQRKFLPEKIRHKRQTLQDMTRPLKKWLYRNRKNPYPSKEEKADLVTVSNMTLTQVSNWFANARRRMKSCARSDNLSWAKRIKDYNQVAEGNVELFSIPSEDEDDDDDDVVDDNRKRDSQDHKRTRCEFDDDEDVDEEEEVELMARRVDLGNHNYRHHHSQSNHHHQQLYHRPTHHYNGDDEDSGWTSPSPSPTLTSFFSDTSITSPTNQPIGERELIHDSGFQSPAPEDAMGSYPKYKHSILQRYLHDASQQSVHRHDLPSTSPMTSHHHHNHHRYRHPSSSTGSHEFEDLLSTSSVSSPSHEPHDNFHEDFDNSSTRHRRPSENSVGNNSDDLYWKEIAAALALTSLARSFHNKV